MKIVKVNKKNGRKEIDPNSPKFRDYIGRYEDAGATLIDRALYNYTRSRLNI